MRTLIRADQEDPEDLLGTEDDEDEESENLITKGFNKLREQNLLVEIIWVLLQHPFLVVFALTLLTAFTIFLLVREDLHWVSAFYLLMQIVTTIGWGDITVDDQPSQLIMAFFVLINLIVIAKVISLVLDLLIERQDRSVRRALRYVESGFRHSEQQDWAKDYVVAKRWEKINKFLFGFCSLAFFIGIGTLFYSLVEYCTCSYGVTQIPGCSRGPHRNDMELCKETGGYVMTWINAFYFSVISLTTVGFGDFAPKSFEGRIFAIPWAFFGVLATGYFIAATSDLLAKEKEDQIIGVADIDESTFNAMDTDNSGYLTKAEFRSFVLVERGIVDEDLLAAIDDKYDYMDQMSPGDQKVTWKDVQEMRRIQLERREEEVSWRDRLWPSWMCG